MTPDILQHLCICNNIIDVLPIIMQHSKTYVRIMYSIKVKLSMAIDLPFRTFWLVEIGIEIAIGNHCSVLWYILADPFQRIHLSYGGILCRQCLSGLHTIRHKRTYQTKDQEYADE